MYYFLFIVHLIISLLLCVVVLVQSSKGGGLAGAFGGAGAGDAVFGARGVTTFLHKATVVLAVAFMVNSALLAVYTASRSTSSPRSLSGRAAEKVPVSTQAGGGGAIPTEAPAGDLVPTTTEGEGGAEEASPPQTGEEGGSEETGSGSDPDQNGGQ